jgi:hypothetical protein
MIYTAKTAPSPSDSWIVYVLTSSLAPDAVRYVGITNDLRRRLSHHINGAPRCRTRKSRWIVSVLRNGGYIVARVLQNGVDQLTAKAAEVQAIKALRDNGIDLTNLTNGGDGTVGRRQTPEARQKLAEAHRGMKASEETRRKMSAAKKGKPSGRSGKKISEASRARISEGVRSRLAKGDVQAKISEALLRRYEDSSARDQTARGERLKPPTSRNKSGFKGVSFCGQTGRWVAQIKTGHRRHLGRFPTPETAARAYDEAAKAAWGSDCYLNFN